MAIKVVSQAYVYQDDFTDLLILNQRRAFLCFDYNQQWYSMYGTINQ